MLPVPLFLLLLALADLPAGQLVESVKCADDPTQSYALYLPARFSPDRVWPVIFAFDPPPKSTATSSPDRTTRATDRGPSA
jgi:hypothetical protein